MANIDFKVFKHHKKENGQYNVKLMIYHNKKRTYLSTSHFVVDAQLKKDYTIKDKDLLALLTMELADYRKKISSLGDKINHLSVQDLGKLLTKPKEIDRNINFIQYGRERVNELREENRQSYAGTFQAVINNLVDYHGEYLPTNEITSIFLKGYESWLRNPRTQVRMIRQNTKSIVQSKGMDDTGIFYHMRSFRLLFGSARKHYNDEDTGIIRIANNPFSKYKYGTEPSTEKRAVPISIIRSIRDCKVPQGGTAELARDLYMASFYLCGINAIDLYSLKASDIKGERLTYNRSKTAGRRSDKAVFSVKIVDEVRPILEKHIGRLSERYKHNTYLNKGLALGLRQIIDLLNDRDGENLEYIDFYSARHTVGTEARNTCGFSVDDVAEVLNHKNQANRVTDKYIKKDWSKVDAIQAALIALL
ncbi:phage integrase SAM-like domain-containing protein [Pedobacter sp. AW1-32]|uniref:phage integrase SAM-like domain-containing protein n=1 Tax=Pedobacter sp. AW1-32 TaxID=3383026 RepID=UPI003FF12993